MDEKDVKKRLVDHVDPNRRSFVRQILGGAAFVPPLIATFSIESLTASPEEPTNSNTCLAEDAGYVGPSAYQAHVSDPTKATRANGVGTFVIQIPPMQPASVQKAQIRYSLVLTINTIFTESHIEIEGKTVCTVNGLEGTIDSKNLNNLCDFDELLQGLAAGSGKLVVQVDYKGSMFTLSGPIVPATANVINLAP
jgi:hypothetical protein